VVKRKDMTKAERTKQFIIESSAPIFNTKGIAATAMSDIMEATKLSKGSLYVHFDNKDVLASAAVDHNMDLLSKKVMAAVGQQKGAKARLFAYIDVFIDPMNPPVMGGCPMMNFGTEADDTNVPVRKKVSEVIERSQDTIVQLIKAGISEGVFRPDWNYKDFATMMFATIEGGVVISRIAGNNSKMKVIARTLKQMINEQSI
ncbi:MAG TPA: TetR/AcrR family transcriptional regulator, partial [Puia sp.]|nr:TetR/AcrR family transcriptional regulator [Puia sp.]